MERPSTASLESAYDEIFRTPIDKLRDTAIRGDLFQARDEGVPARSLAWKLFLTPQPPLTAILNSLPVPPLDSLRASRKQYVTLLKEKMRAPDGSYEEDFHVPGETRRPRLPAARPANTPKKPDDWTLNNPLSLDSSNPWHAYFSALDLRNTIRQDVERTFPEVPYFRSSSVQNEMTHILFLHVNEREHIGYRQGMHELLACIYQAVDFDSVERSANPDLEVLCDRTYVAADAFALFGAVMGRMENWYEWRPRIVEPISPASPVAHGARFSANGEIISSTTPQPRIDVLANGQLDLKPYVAPIVPTCASLRDEKLRAVDPHLWEKLRDGGVEAQMYGIRWLRLLFTREFTLAESMVLWDGLFASVLEDPKSPSSSSEPGFELALWISVAMLIRIRNNLIPGDYTDQLTQLLRYPSPSALGASANTSNAPALLLSQAQLLLESPNPSTGASLVMQNRNELGIPVDVPDPPAPSPSRRRRRASLTAPPTVSASQSRNTHDRPRLQDMITNRLMDANESLGIQRGIFNTITEIRRNLPDLSQTLIRTPSWNGSSISLVDERNDSSQPARTSATNTPEVTERPPWEPKPRSEIEREIAELRALLKTLGNAVGWAVDVLLLDKEAEDTEEGEKSLREKKMEAVECMAYVRDVLARGGKGEIDEERLVSEEEYQRQRRVKQEREREAVMNARPPAPKLVIPPPRAASSADLPDAKSKPRTILSTRDSTRPIPSLTRTPIASSLPPGIPTPSLSSRTTQVPRPTQNLPMMASTAPDRKVFAPPWQYTPSNFSEHSPYASGSLPRLPPPSTTAPSRLDRRSSDHSHSQTLPPNEHDPPRATDPLGVLHDQR